MEIFFLIDSVLAAVIAYLFYKMHNGSLRRILIYMFCTLAFENCIRYFDLPEEIYFIAQGATMLGMMLLCLYILSKKNES